MPFGTRQAGTYAEVVELVDTLCSGRSELTLVRVRLPSSASLRHKDLRDFGVSPFFVGKMALREICVKLYHEILGCVRFA